MNVQELIQDIEEESLERKHLLQMEAKKEVREIELETSRILAERRKTMYDEIRRQEQEALARETARLQLEARKAELALKQELIDKAFSKALQELKKRKGKKRTDILSKLWKKVSTMTKITHVEVSKSDASFFKGKSKAKKIDCVGGFIAYGKDVVVDCRYETLINEIRDNKIDEIAGALFNE